MPQEISLVKKRKRKIRQVIMKRRSSCFDSGFLAVLLLLCCCRHTTFADEFVRLCTLRDSRIIPVILDEVLGEYVQVSMNDDNNGDKENNNTDLGDNTRHLRSSDADEVSFAISVSTSTPHRRIQKQQQDIDNNITENVFYVRQCVCPTRPWDQEIRAYCPVDKTTCGISRLSNETIACFNQSSRTSLIRNAWPVIVLWYGGLVIFLLFTAQGRNARHYVVSKCCNSNLNDYLIENYWYIEGGFWRRRRRRRTAIPTILQNNRQRADTRRQEREQEVPPLPPNTLHHLMQAEEQHHAPNELALKTKRYVAPATSADVDEDDLACTICFSPLEDGDRVGALPCHHEFHVECLKLWLRRRNTCPLCQAPDVAAPQYNHARQADSPFDVEENEEDNSVVEQVHSSADNEEDANDQQDLQQPPSIAMASDTAPTGMHHRPLGLFGGRRVFQQRRRR